MDTVLLKKHITVYKQNLLKPPEKHAKDLAKRKERIAYYQSWTKARILSMKDEEFYEYLSRLWAMLIWGNKHYVVDKMIADNGFDTLKRELSERIWGASSAAKRWNYKKILEVHDALEMVNESINSLGLVPQGF